MIPDAIREQGRDCLASFCTTEESTELEERIVQYLVKEYLMCHNTSDRTIVTMYQYLIQRCIERERGHSETDEYDEHKKKRDCLADPWDDAPDVWRHALATDTSEQQVQTQQQGTPTNQFLCTKCGQRKCIFSTAQTRSADEGMTTFVSCLNCGKTWKMN